MKKNFMAVALNRVVRYSLRSSSFLNKDGLFLVEYPKSGASWIGEMLSSALEVPFPRNVTPASRFDLLHGHYLPSQLNLQRQSKLPLLVVRDPRDVLVSWYFHSFFVNERYNERHVLRMKKRLKFEDYDDVKKNIHDFLKLALVDKFPLGFNWTDFYSRWREVPHVAVSYEQMRRDPEVVLKKLVKHYSDDYISDHRIANIVEQYSFNRAAGRLEGEENRSSFIRKGIIGDYQNHLGEESLKFLNFWLGEEARHWGYDLEVE